MRVLMVMEKTSAFGYLIQEYARAITDSGHTLVLSFLTGEPRPDYYDKVAGVQIRFEQLSPKALRGLRLRGIATARALVREEQPDVVIAHQFSTVVCTALARPLAGLHYRMIGVFHGINAGKASSRQLFLRLFGKLVDRYVMVSELQGENFRRFNRSLPRERFVTIHNIVDGPRMNALLLPREQARAELGLDNAGFLFGYVGRLNRKKGIYELIDGFAAANANMADTRLVMIGDGPEDAGIKEAAANASVAERVTFTGHLPDAWRYMRAFDVFVLPSWGESFGMVLAEAMLAGVPVIATTGGAIPEVLGDAAVRLFPVADAEAIRDALLHARQLSDERRQHFSDAGLARVQENFLYQGMKQKLATLITEG